MQHWSFPADAGAACALLPCIATLGSETFAGQGLAALNAAGLRAGSWSVYRTGSGNGGVPQLHLSASDGPHDRTRDCFAAYAAGLYRGDRSFDAVPAGAGLLLRMHADEAPSADHRDAIYRRHGMHERLSIAAREDDGSVFAINLYRHDAQARFADDDVAAIASQAPLLLALVRRHVALTAPASPRQRLLARCPALTERELDVCERLLRGWTHDGIAADLGLSLPTVKTYRARAFARLGLHFRSELFAALAS